MLIKRNKSKKIKVGCIQIGNSNNIIIQSMTNTKTSNIDSTLKQIIELKKNGCDLVRVSVLDQEDCNALKIIIKQAPCPIIADIHYNHQFAIDAIKANVAKIRINPANIANEENLHQIVSMAKKYKVAIRIGLNKGSYDKISNNELINQAILYIKKFES
jgi:(E)-4-hydroxy-3-methylbut-2-enyl-diphosphate synthase